MIVGCGKQSGDSCSRIMAKKIAEKVLLPRLLMNCGIQPWFRFAWNVDRIFLVDDQLWLFEVKHKFPFSDRETDDLIFGLNNGEVTNFSLLADCGIRTLFSIMVKPKWSKTIGSLYKMTDLKARENTAVIGKVLDSARLKRLMGTSSGTTGSDTTITGDKMHSSNTSRFARRNFVCSEGSLTDHPTLRQRWSRKCGESPLPGSGMRSSNP